MRGARRQVWQTGLGRVSYPRRRDLFDDAAAPCGQDHPGR